MITEELRNLEAQKGLLTGVERVYNATAPTLGSAGRNAVFYDMGKPKVTNDGVSIARKIFPKDKHERYGADLINIAAEKTVKEVGDGTTSTIIMSYHLVKQGAINPNKLKKELNQACELAIQKLEERKIEVKTDEDLLKIANISVENKEIAQTIVEAIRDAGETGRVVVMPDFASDKITKENVPGFEAQGGYTNPFMVTNNKKEAILENARVLISDQVFNLNKELMPWLDDCMKAKVKNVLMIVKGLETAALQTIYMAKAGGSINVVAVPAPDDKEFMEDLATLTNGIAVTSDKGIKDITLKELGFAKKIIVSEDKYLIVRDETLDSSRYEARIEELKGQIEETGKEELKDRLARLTGKVVILKVGDSNQSEMLYLKDKIDDAVAATQSALKGGYATGAGLTVYDVCKDVSRELQTMGAARLLDAAKAPIEILISNAGETFDPEKINATDGFDTDSCTYVSNIAEIGVIDPILVMKSVVRNSVSFATNFLTISTSIVDVD